MSDKIIHLNEEVIKGQIKELVLGSVEETFNELLEAEADRLTQARYEHNDNMDSPSEKLGNVVASLPQGDSFRRGHGYLCF